MAAAHADAGKPYAIAGGGISSHTPIRPIRARITDKQQSGCGE
jgi:hypothetical protein